MTSVFSALLDHPDMIGVGIDESTAIVVYPQENIFEVISESQVMVIGRETPAPNTPPKFNVELLSSCDKYEM